MGDSIPYTDGMLATIFRRKEATVKMALDIFERFGMIERLDGSLGDTASAAKDAADATEDAAKAAEDYLSPLDDLNKFTAEDTTSKASSGNSGSSGGGVDPGQMFEDVPIESNIEKIFQKIKDLIKSGDFEGLGEMMADAINRGLKKVKKAISWDNVGPTVTYFVTAFIRWSWKDQGKLQKRF